MESHQEPQSFSLKILVDKGLQKVVVAEATKDFVETLFSFLTLPLGTIIRLVGNKDLQHPASLGSINNLYQSVENLDSDNFLNDICKNMLLNPRNSCHALCSKLLMNVDDTEPPKYFSCRYCSFSLSTFANARCTCGRLMDREENVRCSEEEPEIEVEGGVFVKGGSNFLVFDDLKVTPNSFDNSLQLLIQLGYRDFSQLEETFINIGLPEVLKLLKNMLISHEPLTHTLLENDVKDEKQLKLSAFKADAKLDGNENDIIADVEARYHESDTGSDPPERPTHIPSQCEGSVAAARKRGPNRSLRLHKKIGRGKGRLVPVQFDTTGTWHAVGENASHLPRDIGSMIRTHMPPYYKSWRVVPQQIRDRVVQKVCSHFEFQGISEGDWDRALSSLMWIAADLYRDWKYRLNKHFLEHGGDRYQEYDLDRARHCVPQSVSPQTWQRCVNFFDSDEYRELSGRNTNNKAQKVVNDQHRSKSIAVHRFDKRNRDTGELQSVSNNFRDRHTHRSGEWVHPIPQGQHVRMIELMTQHVQSSVSSTSLPTTPVQLDKAVIADEVLGTHRGYKKVVGRLLAGQSYHSVGTSSTGTSSQTVSQVGELQEQLQQSREQFEQSQRLIQEQQHQLDQQQQQITQQQQLMQQQQQQMQQQLGTYLTEMSSILRQQGIILPPPPFAAATPPGPSRFTLAPAAQPPRPSQPPPSFYHPRCQDDDDDDDGVP